MHGQSLAPDKQSRCLPDEPDKKSIYRVICRIFTCSGSWSTDDAKTNCTD